MTIEKLPSGSYRIKQQYKGKRYTVTVPYKPTQKEAIKLIAEAFDKQAQKTVSGAQDGTFDSYAIKYINDKETDGASPATIRGYWTIQRSVSEDFKNKRISDITADDVKEEIELYESNPNGKKPRMPKTVRNYHGFIHSVLKANNPGIVLSTKLPKVKKKQTYKPTTKDVQRILEDVKGTKWEIVFQLCVRGLRRGEAVCITAKDVDEDNVLTIDKDLVQDKNEKYVIKDHPKTEDSYRRIPIPKYLADLIREKGVAYEGDPHEVNVQLHREQKKLGIPEFNLHYLRHFCAAYLHKQGFTDEQIMSFMGFSTDDIMKEVYRYNLDPHESMADINKAFDSF